MRRRNWTQKNIESSDLVLESVSTEQRFDIAFSTKEIIGEAAGPTTTPKTKLKRIAHYLKGRQRCVLHIPWVAKLEDVIHVTLDADWAGDPKTRCSTSGGALAIGPCFTVRLCRRHRQQCHYRRLSQSPRRSRRAVLKLCT